jgi:hypothetical protein
MILAARHLVISLLQFVVVIIIVVVMNEPVRSTNTRRKTCARLVDF